ncbi:uncharacterized protein L969DRAFT_86880, partial [Mixia osmundae IAM 14324]|uniref:uncharacterized protein n=1 Tax=Mixia osmundae (strain CBS 9802 / IAM 14324 / JCM 22182 / KY 12970) TaxID=764103 RepID=UPI0004A5481F
MHLGRIRSCVHADQRGGSVGCNRLPGCVSRTLLQGALSHKLTLTSSQRDCRPRSHMADEHELLLVDGSQSWLRSTTARFSSVLPWLSFALVGDWIVVLVIQLFERQVRASAVHEEDVKLYLDDPSIMYRHTDVSIDLHIDQAC